MKATQDTVVSMHYTLTDDAGAVLDSSRERGEPMDYLHGHGNIIGGLETALDGQSAGFKSQVTVAPEQGYGEHNAQAVFDVPRSQFPDDDEINLGAMVHGETPQGVVTFTVVGMNQDSVTLDGNHPLAGKTLHFDVEIMDIREATEQELSHGHVHTGGHDH